MDRLRLTLRWTQAGLSLTSASLTDGGGPDVPLDVAGVDRPRAPWVRRVPRGGGGWRVRSRRREVQEERGVRAGVPDEVGGACGQDVRRVVRRCAPELGRDPVRVESVVVVLVLLRRSDEGVPHVPSRRFRRGRRVGVQVLADQRGSVSRPAEPGRDRRFLQAQLVEHDRASVRLADAVDPRGVGVLPAQDRGAGGTAERIHHEGVREGDAFIDQAGLNRRHP